MPCDFFLFSRLKLPLRGKLSHRLESIDTIKKNSPRILKTILKIDQKRCFEHWKKCWHKCIAVRENYFEGDEIG